MKILIATYDWFAAHKRSLWLLLAVLCLLLGLLASRLRFHEDIFDFLPKDREYTESMQVYSSLNEAARIVVIFQGTDPDSICRAIDAFGEARPEAITEVDLDGFVNRLDYVYRHLPYFLREQDYDSLTVRLSELPRWMLTDKELLSTPGTAFLSGSVAADPLRLVSLDKGVSGQYAGAQSAFSSYDGYMMTADHTRGFAFCDSPYGSTESGRNAGLVDSLQALSEQLMLDYPTVGIRLIGSPVVAVGNARRIKRDSIMAIAVSLVLIIALLLYAFPRKRDILLILLSVGFGWLTGVAALALCGIQVSLIVIGIGAILIGIAVNYPLHLLVHQRYTATVRQTLQEVLSPLVVGNITTIGAFLALIPLSSPALRQLGIFAAALFVGTIVFCTLFLPHLMSAEPTPVRELPLPSLPKRFRAIAIVLLCIAIAAGAVFTGGDSLFDSNLSHINYMTPQQRADFAWFESLSPASDEPAYLSSGAREELRRREALWQTYWQTHCADTVAAQIRIAAEEAGFLPTAFEPFCRQITSPLEPADLSNLETLASLWPGRFDAPAMNSRVATSLSDSFDYLGLACSLIVLLFLILSFRSVVLGLIAFLPMVLSWILIFALMQIFGLQFNIVNVILATFIFGQGDDYTIFVVEGLLYEHRTGKPILPQYKQSILLSALIMLLAIGVLAFAQHPAMHSLGAVTLIGMICVVLMAYAVPPVMLRLVLRIPAFRKRILKEN